MILTCQRCNTRYMVADDAIGADGRTVRCAVCAHEWFVSPLDIDPELVIDAPAEPADAPTPQDSGVAQEQTPQSYHANLPALIPPQEPGVGLIGVLMAALVLLLVGVYLIGDRDRVVSLWPPAAHAYDVLGLPVERPSLSFSDVDLSVQEGGDGARVFLVTGTIANNSSTDLRVPPIIVTLRDEAGRTVFAGDATAPVVLLKAGETVPFRQAIFNPPAEARKAEISLPR